MSEDSGRPEDRLIGPRGVGGWTYRRIALAAFIVALVAAVAWRAPESLGRFFAHLNALIVAITLAVILAYVLKPLADSISDHPFWGAGKFVLPRWAATLFALVTTLVAITLVGVMIAHPLALQVTRLLTDLPRLVQVAMHYAAQMPEQWRNVLGQQASALAATLPERLTKGATAAVGLLPYLVELLLVPVLAYYFVADAKNLRQECFTFLPRRAQPVTARLLGDFGKVLDGYVRGQLILCLIAAVVVTVGLTIARVDFAVALGLFAGLTRAIPIIGPVFGAVPIVIVVLGQLGVTAAAVATALFAAMHVLESKLLMPKLIGDRVNLHPVTVIVALLVGKEWFGLLGMLVATPIAALVKVIILHSREYATSLRGED
jgi:predicted PurR-regulated permease PerM